MNAHEIAVTAVRNPDELEILFEIRRTVFVEEQHVAPEEEYDEFENTSVHYLATYDGTVCGTARRRYTEDGIKLERFAVLEEFRGQGVGKALVRKVLEEIAKEPESEGKLLYLHAQLAAVHLYEIFGFHITGEKFSEAGIEHYKMTLRHDELAEVLGE